MFGLSPEALIALLQGLMMFADWAVKLAKEIVATNSQLGPITQDQWNKWDLDILTAHTDVQRV